MKLFFLLSKRYFISMLLVSIGRQNFQELETMNVCAMKRKINLIIRTQSRHIDVLKYKSEGDIGEKETKFFNDYFLTK
jgi:hypothetical protein